jgi:hypothetical protein
MVEVLAVGYGIEALVFRLNQMFVVAVDDTSSQYLLLKLQVVKLQA